MQVSSIISKACHKNVVTQLLDMAAPSAILMAVVRDEKIVEVS